MFVATGSFDDGTKVAYDDETGEWRRVDEETYAKTKSALAPVSEEALEMGAEGVGPFEAALIGAGKTFHDLGRGAQDLYYRATGQEDERAALQAEQAARSAAYDPLAQARPFSTGIGESVPYMAAGGAMGVGRTLASALGRQALAGGAVGATEYAPTLEQRAIKAGLEATLGAAGEGVGRGLGRLATPGLMPKTDVNMQMIDEAEALGFQALPATLVESDRFRNVIEGSLETMPTSSFVLDAARAENERLFSRYAAEAIGQEGADAVNDVVLDKAHRDLGRVFNDVMGRDARYVMDDATLDMLERIESERIYPYLVGQDDPVRNLVDTTLDMMTKRPSGEVTGRELQANITKLGNHARSKMRGPNADPELGLALYDFQDLMLDVVERQASPKNVARLQKARLQYRNLANLKSAVDPVTGKIQPGVLHNRLRNRDELGYMRGQNRDPFYTATRFMARIQPELRTSGTQERSALQNAIANIAHLGPGAVGAAASSPLLAGAGVVAPFVLPYVAAKGYTTRGARNWLMNQPFEMRIPENWAYPGGVSSVDLPLHQGPSLGFTQQGALGMGGIGLLHGIAGLHQ